MTDNGLVAGPPAPHPAARLRGLRRLRRLAIVLAVLLGGLDLAATAVLFWTQARESEERRAESCKLFVGRWKADQDQITQTRGYLKGLLPAERRTALNKRVASNIPQLVERAKLERPPGYCSPEKDRVRRKRHPSRP